MTSVSRKKAKAYFIAACIVIAAIGNAALQIWFDFQETVHRQETTARDVSQVVVAQIHESVHQAQTVLGLLADMIQADKGLDNIREPARWKKLHAFCESLTGCKSIAVVDPDGKIVALSDLQNSPVLDASDRVYFRVTKETNKLFVGPAVISRVPGNPILFSIARPVSDASGKLLAIISAGMTTAHWTDFYGLMGFNVNPTVTVFKANGDLVARFPDMARYVGGNFASGPLFTEQLPKSSNGVYRSVSILDGKTRIASFQAMNELDLIVYAGVDMETALRDWTVRARRTVVTSVVALLLIFLALYWGYRSFGRATNLQAENIELDRISNLDALTEIANRRFFDATLEREWTRHRNENRPLSLLMVDVDCFKQFNDHYGHQSGDDCLRKIATTLQNVLLRNADLAARYGGEEFAVVLDADQKGAVAVGERIRSAVEALGIPHAWSSAGLNVTISVGVASISSSAARNPAELINAADTALYEAKHLGRNQVVTFPTQERPARDA